ncbi:hypothetical protein D3C81_1928380 [compost metagenome]
MQVDAAGQLGDRYAVAWLEEHQRRTLEYRVAGSPGVLPHGNHVFLADFTCFQRLADDVAGHHFGQTGWIAAGIGVHFRQNFTGVVINQDVGFRIDLRYPWDHGLDINVIGMRNGGCTHRDNGAERYALD